MGNRNEDPLSQSDPGGNTSGVAIALEPSNEGEPNPRIP